MHSLLTRWEARHQASPRPYWSRGIGLSDVQHQLMERDEHQHDQPEDVTRNIGIKRANYAMMPFSGAAGVFCSMAAPRLRCDTCNEAQARAMVPAPTAAILELA